MTNLTIRPGTIDDLPFIHQMVTELAIYEKEPEAVTATLDDYRRDFESDIFQTLVAEVDGKPVGMMLYFMMYSTWKGRMMYLDDFYIKPSHRRMGIGERLFEAFKDISKQQDCKLIKWQVLDWNEPAIKFYEKVGATIEREWWNGKQYL